MDIVIEPHPVLENILISLWGSNVVSLEGLYTTVELEGYNIQNYTIGQEAGDYPSLLYTESWRSKRRKKVEWKKVYVTTSGKCFMVYEILR